MPVTESTHRWYREPSRFTEEQAREENKKYERWRIEKAEQLRCKKQRIRIVS
jgi:hypothetical protein